MKVLHTDTKPQVVNLHFPGSGTYYVELCEGVEARITITEAKHLFEKSLHRDNLFLYREYNNTFVFRAI